MKNTLQKLLRDLLEIADKQQGEQIAQTIFKLLATQLDLDKTQRNDLKTKYSFALNAYDSAYCITYYNRTKKSLQAVLKQLIKAEQRVLYIGTGPFAPYFLFPLLLGVSAQFTLLEINPYSVQVLKRLIQKFDLQDFVYSVVQADATTWNVDRAYDVVLCETPDVGLRREDTLPIYKNLTAQLPRATYIPKEVLILTGTGGSKKVQYFDSLSAAIKRGSFKTQLPFPIQSHPFIQNKIILDDELVLEPYESVVTMPLFLSSE